MSSSSPKKNKSVIGLFDSGASNTFVKKEALKGVAYKSSKVNVKVKGRYSSTYITEKATFNVLLPDFASSKAVEVSALVKTVHPSLAVMPLYLDLPSCRN